MPAHLLFGPDGRPLRNTNRNGSGSWEGSGYDLPHVLTFGALLSGANHTYWHDRFDRAMESSRKDAVIMENDVFLMGLLQERMLSVVSKKWSIKVPNEKDPRQAFVRDHLQTAIEQIPRFQHIRMALLWAVWYGRQAIHPKWCWKWQDRVKTLSIRKWYPIQGDKIGHQHDGTPYVLGHTGEIRNLPGVEVVVTQRGHAVRLNQAWRDRFIIHSHDLRDVDFYDWQRAEAIHGIGIRSVIHWMNWLKLEYLGAICDWVERVGLGVNLWYYSASNPAAREEAMLAAREQSNRTNLVVPYFEDQKHPGLERVETPTAGADLLIRLQEKIDEYIERFVVGQEMSASGTSTGLGNEAAAEFQESTKHQITKWDAGNEDESLTGSDDDPGIVSMLQRHTFPETWPSERNPDGFRCVFCTEVEPPDHATRLEAAASAVEMGVEVKADEIRELAGLSKPGPDDEKVGGQQAMPPPGMGPMGNGDGGSPGMDGGDGDAPPDHPFEPNQPYQRRVWDTGWQQGFGAGYAKAFDEKSVKRDEEGKFAEKAGGIKRNAASILSQSHDMTGEFRRKRREEGSNYREGDEEFERKQWVRSQTIENVMDLEADDFAKLMRDGEGRKDMAKGNAAKLAREVFRQAGKPLSIAEAKELVAGIDPSRFGKTHYSPTGGRHEKMSGGITQTTEFLPSEAVYRAIHEALTGKHPEQSKDDAEGLAAETLAQLFERLGGKVGETRLRQHHRKAVEEALAAGERVRPEVLADYPDLTDGNEPEPSDKPPPGYLFERNDLHEHYAAPWQEQAHPRGQPQNKGQFTSGGGGGGAAAKPRPQYPRGSAGDRAQQRKQSRRKKPDPAQVPTIDHQKKRGWAGLVRHAIGTVRDNLTWTSLKARGAALLHAAGHPRETAGRAREVATARLSALRQRYGTAGAAAIGGAYVGYYVLASTVNPSLLLIPVPLTATLITSAEAIRYVGKKATAALGYAADPLDWTQTPEDNWTIEDLAAEAKALTAEIAQVHGEPAPHMDDEVLAQVIEALLEDGKEGEGEGEPQGYDRDTDPLSYEVDWNEADHPRDQEGKWIDRGAGVRSVPKAKPTGEGKAPRRSQSLPKAERPTLDQIHEHIEKAKENATPADVQWLAKHLEGVSVNDLSKLKKSLGIRAGGRKSEMVQKIAALATKRLSVREHWTREARKKGIRTKDLISSAKILRQNHNETAALTDEIVRKAKESYAHHNDGKSLTRAHRAFRGGDWTQLKGWDQLSESLMHSYPEILGQDPQDAYEKVYTLVAGGPAPRLSYEDSYSAAIDWIESMGVPEPTRRRKKGDASEGALPGWMDEWSQLAPDDSGEAIPFARDAEPSSSHPWLTGLMEAMLDADDAELRDIMAEMADEPPDVAPDDDDEEEPTPEARAKVAAMVDEIVRRRLDGQQAERAAEKYAKAFDESKVKRDEEGKFAEKAGGGSDAADPSVIEREKAVKKLVKGTQEKQELHQPRAKKGGELGPNDEWYPGGAFIATQDLPKRVKEKILKTATGKVEVESYKWEVPEPGMMSIMDKLAGTVLNPRNGEINYDYLEYLKKPIEEVKMYEEIAQRWKDGERWISVNDYPKIAGIKDAARLVVAGKPVPGAILDRLPAEWKSHLERYRPAKEEPEAEEEPEPDEPEEPEPEPADKPPPGWLFQRQGGIVYASDLAALASEAGVDISGIDPEQLRQGMAVEREHNRGDTDVVQSDADLLKIAVAHLRESPDYYRALAEMEKSLQKYAKAWSEKNHPRGQPGNPGQFAEKEGSTSPQADTGPGLFDEPPAEKPKAEKKPRRNAKKTLSQKLGLDQPLPQTPDLPDLPEAEPVGAVKPRKPWWDLGHSLEQATHLREGVKQLAALRPVLDRFNEQYGAVQDAIIEARSAAGVVKNLDRKDAPAKERQEAETLAVERLEQVKKIWEEVKGHRESLDRRVREHLQAVFGVDDQLQIKTGTTNVGSLSGPWEQQFRDNIDTALAFLQPFVGKQEAPESLPPINFVMKQERANYKDSEKTVSVNFFKDDMGTVVHEIAHSLEFNISAVMGQCQDFLKERVGDAEYRKINDIIGVKAYRDDEIGAEDDFTKAFGHRASYVGKKYPFEATEILSMGMEQLYRDPVGFAEKDPEYVAFLMGVLRGDLR